MHHSKSSVCTFEWAKPAFVLLRHLTFFSSHLVFLLEALRPCRTHALTTVLPTFRSTLSPASLRTIPVTASMLPWTSALITSRRTCLGCCGSSCCLKSLVLTSSVCCSDDVSGLRWPRGVALPATAAGGAVGPDSASCCASLCLADSCAVAVCKEERRSKVVCTNSKERGEKIQENSDNLFETFWPGYLHRFPVQKFSKMRIDWYKHIMKVDSTHTRLSQLLSCFGLAFC